MIRVCLTTTTVYGSRKPHTWQQSNSDYFWVEYFENPSAFFTRETIGSIGSWYFWDTVNYENELREIFE